jgi:hypothetical protein
MHGSSGKFFNLAKATSCGLLLGLVSSAAIAADLGGNLKDEPRRDSDSRWQDVKFSGHIQGGYTYNGANPEDGLNFGHLFTDRSDTALLNQFILTLERPLDSKKADQFQMGFKLQGMYGSDARYTHFLGEFDKVTRNRHQLDVVEAFLNYHLPILTQDGVDVKIGQYVTLEGAEVIYAPSNFFYSHSYIFNFGIPFKHTGIMTTTHVNPLLDLYLGVDTGVNTTFGRDGDNNDAIAFHGGIGLNLLNGDLTILATTHIGPELSRNTPGVDPNRDLRYLNDITTVWKVTKKLTSTTDLNYIRDNGLKAQGWGIAQYLTYALDDNWSLGIRGEVWKDQDGAFVAVFPGTQDFVNAEKGLPNGAIPGGPTTYYALTLGVNYKPPVEKRFDGLVIRPEIRWDWSSNTTPFNAGTEDRQFTAGIDIILPFTR